MLEVAIALAGFSVGEAEGLRRAMSRKRSEEAIEGFRERFVEGAVAKGVEPKLADEVYDKLVGFSGFGFPKSHAAAFGLLAYQSAWLRHHFPAEFLCALLNAQPMGFYPPASLVRDAQRRGVEVRPPNVNRSQAKCTIEPSNTVLQGAVRIGLEYVTSIGADDAQALSRAAPFESVVELAQRTAIGREGLESLIASGACDGLGSSRRALLWELGLVPALAERPRLGRCRAPARAPARSDRRDARARRADRMGGDARELPPNEPLGRRAPDGAHPPASPRRCPFQP